MKSSCTKVYNNCVKKIYVLTVLSSVILFFSCTSPDNKKEEVTSHRLSWWDDAKFGLFIHWGVYAVPAGIYQGNEIPGIGEWIMSRAKIPVSEYRQYADQFNPVKYDPQSWVRLAKGAGMKYLVITSKHHDGFALFDSKVTEWDVVDATPYGKDLLKPLADACKMEGIKLGFYYSQAQDWTHKGGAAPGRHWDETQHGDMDEYLDKIAVPQVKEILENYGGLDILWWDTPNNMTPERAAKFLPVIAEYPDLITNNRLGGGISGDTETPEQSIPATGSPGRRFEVCMTMNDTWGYKSMDHNWKSTRDLVHKLSEIVSKGGNFLLNVGPTAEGEIPQASIERLQEIGEWMKVNGDAIYGTKASPFSYLPWGRATIRGQKLYLHVLKWPEDGILKLPLLYKVNKTYALKNPDSRLKTVKGKDKIMIHVPAKPPDEILTIIVLEIKDKPKVLPIPTEGKSARVSSMDADADVSNLFDGNPGNHWKAAPGDFNAWIEIDLEEEVSIGNITVAEPWRIWHNKGQEFILQYKKGEEWIDAVRGKTTGAGYSKDFEAVTGRFFRLNINGPPGEPPLLNELILNRAL